VRQLKVQHCEVGDFVVEGDDDFLESIPRDRLRFQMRLDKSNLEVHLELEGGEVVRKITVDEQLIFERRLFHVDGTHRNAWHRVL
jgi:hypothetical protein